MEDSYDIDGDPFGFANGNGRGQRPSGLSRGVENLLLKAVAAWSAGDDARADRLLDRTVAMPFDRHEKAWPAPTGAAGLLFELLTHTVETSEPREWFAAVEATFTSLDDDQRVLLCDGLAPVVRDWRLDAELDRRVRALVADRLGGELRYDDDTTDRAELRDVTESILWVAVRLSEELDARGLCAHLTPEYW